MGTVIHVKFGEERQWSLYRDELVNGLVVIGRYYGAPEHLMRAKGDCAVRLLRQMVNEVPNINLAVKIPDGLSPEQTQEIIEATKAAANTAVEHTVWHCVNCVLESLHDLCTTKLTPASSDAGS